MSIELSRLGLVPSEHQSGRSPSTGLHPLQQAAMRLSDVREGRSRLKAKDLVGLLLSHGARAWRASQPVCYSRIKTAGPCGASAVRLRFR